MIKQVKSQSIASISAAFFLGLVVFTSTPVLAGEVVSSDVSEGSKLALSGQYDAALDKLNAAVKAEPSSGKAYLKRAAILAKMHKYGDALNDCSKSIKLDSKNPRAYALRGLLYKHLGNIKKEVADMRTARELLKNSGK